ncbi:hypothetical protein BHK98_01655 [Hornefia porci]|uniref:tRNA(Met) cytidine acetate ligase n=1 Tax=Hornefia porci TaxID=2652292 RepID=A0A1Q9JFC7_9FIRM|nr:nucleotidyltransferase family protein [Hornefia porci]OLR54898.1 hypothetical protein BHK98_01655 [Hornefia porci]
MKAIGIIGEYNPFHNGHAYLLEKAMKATEAKVCVSVMSGDFTQRGTPAVYDKWDRAQTAVQNGINVVCELPTVFACNSAEYFARGAVRILEGFGCIDYLAFGSESGDIDALSSASRTMVRNEAYIEQIAKELLKHGNSYPKARTMAARQLAPELDEALIREPNNILAIEYLKHIKNMRPVTIKRRGDSYHESGAKQREILTEQDPDRFEHMDQAYFSLVSARILQSDNEQLEEIFSAGEGLGNKLKNEIRYVSSTEQLIQRIKSKAYTRTRISRLLTQVLLGITEDTVRNAKPYIRLLALDDVGAKFIKEMKKNDSCTIPVITNINREKDDYPEIATTLATDILASDMYNIITRNDLYDYSDYIKAPFIGI